MHVHQGYSIQCDGYANCYAYNIAADESAKKMTQECEAGNKLQWLAITHMRSIIQGISDGATDAWELENFLTAAAASTSHTWEGNLAHIIDMWRDLRLEKMFLYCNAWFLMPWGKKHQSVHTFPSPSYEFFSSINLHCNWSGPTSETTSCIPWFHAQNRPFALGRAWRAKKILAALQQMSFFAFSASLALLFWSHLTF